MEIEKFQKANQLADQIRKLTAAKEALPKMFANTPHQVQDYARDFGDKALELAKQLILLDIQTAINSLEDEFRQL